MAPERINGASCGGAQQGLELGEGLLDRRAAPHRRWWSVLGARREVRTVRRQVEEFGALSLDRGAHALDLVGAKVVQHHDVARAQGRRQRLLDIGEEARAVDRAVEDAGRADAVVAQRGQEGRGLPVAMRHGSYQPLPAPGAAVPPAGARYHLYRTLMEWGRPYRREYYHEQAVSLG
jgi:hypothetical protein